MQDPEKRRGLCRAALARCAGLCTILAVVAGCAGYGAAGLPYDGGSSPVPTRVVAELRADEGTDRFPVVRVGLAEVRAPTDRDPTEEPVAFDAGQLDLQAEPNLELAPALPGLYGRLRMRIDSGVWGRALEVQIATAAEPIVVTLSGEITVEQTCGEVLTLERGNTLTMRLTLPLERLAERLAAVSLPAPTDGVIRVDETSSPEGMAQLAAWLDEDMPLECEVAPTPRGDAGVLDGGADAPQVDGAAPGDGGAGDDARVMDGGPADGALPVDAPPADALPDAPPVDAAPPDAGADAGA